MAMRDEPKSDNTPKSSHDVTHTRDTETGEHGHKTPDPHKIPEGTKPPELKDSKDKR